MKSFFKKLSLVLAAAMVITMLPLQGAKAATAITVGLSGDSKNPNPSAVTLNVGDTQSWKFTGVDKYNAAGAATKKWNSSDPTVVSVNNGAIKALKAGTAKITLQLTNNGIQYAGTTTVTVVDPKAAGQQTIGNVSAKQTAYNAVTLTFADKATAEAAKDKVVVERVKASAKGDWYLNVRPDKAVVNNTLVISPLSDQVTYRITVPGVAQPFFVSMSVGEATDLILEYPTVYMGTGYDIEGNPIKQPTVTPIVKVVDANGVAVNTGNNKVTFTTDKAANSYVNFTPSTGKVKFTSINGSCYVKATYKFTNAAKETVTLTDDITVTPATYQAPNLQGFVEKICLTTESDPKKVVYPSDYDFKGELAIGQTKKIAYYFETTDGALFTGANVADTVKKDGIKVAYANDYDFYFVKDDASAVNVSLIENGATVEVKGWTEGTERICLYRANEKGKHEPKTDALVGVIDIKVDPEPYVSDMGLTEDTVDGFTNGIYQYADVEYAFKDQYDNKIAGEVTVSKPDGGSVNWAEVITDQKVNGKEYKKTDGKGIIRIKFNILGPNDGTELKVTVKGQKPEYSEIISVSAQNIKLDSTNVSYEIEVANSDVKNANINSTTGIHKIGSTIKVVELRDGNPAKYVPFTVVSNDSFDALTPADRNLLYVVVQDSDDKPVKKDATNAIETTGATISAATWANQSLGNHVQTGTEGYFFDGYNDAGEAVASSIGESLLIGNYTAYLYRTTGTNKGNFDTEASADFAFTNSAELLQKTNNTYKLEKDGDKVKVTDEKVWADDADCGVITSDAAYKALINSIVGELYTWLDVDSNGKVGDGEIKQIKNLDGRKTIELSDVKFQKGANDAGEIFIKTVTITFKVAPNVPYVTQTLDINRKYSH